MSLNNRHIHFVALMILLYGTVSLAHVVEPNVQDQDVLNQEVYGDSEFWNIDNYEERTVEGFKVYLHLDALEDKSENTEALYEHIESSITYMRRRLPVKAFDKLVDEGVKFVVNDLCSEPRFSIAYHPDWYGWSEFRRKSISYCHIDSGNRGVYASPAVVIHEIAHAFHDLFIENGYDNEAIIEYFARVRDSGKFDVVNGIFTSYSSDREKAKPYMLTNHKEFFAEISEALWLRNNWEPFTFFDVYNNETLTDWCETDMNVHWSCDTNPNFRYNLVYDYWFRYSGPHNGVWWYHQVLEGEEETVTSSSNQNEIAPMPFWLDLDYVENH